MSRTNRLNPKLFCLVCIRTYILHAFCCKNLSALAHHAVCRLLLAKKVRISPCQKVESPIRN